MPARYRAAVPQQATTAATHLRVILVGAAVNKIYSLFFLTALLKNECIFKLYNGVAAFVNVMCTFQLGNNVHHNQAMLGKRGCADVRGRTKRVRGRSGAGGGEGGRGKKKATKFGEKTNLPPSCFGLACVALTMLAFRLVQQVANRPPTIQCWL